MCEYYDVRRVCVEDRVAHVTIDHPPVNILDTKLIGDLGRFMTEVRDDNKVRSAPRRRG